MQSHVTAVAVLHIGFGILGLILGVALFVILGWAATFVEEPDVEFLLPTLAVLIGGGIAFFSIIDIVGGIGLLGYRPWARILVLISSVLDLLNIPIGTAIGIYSIIILVHADTARLFEQKSPIMPPYSPPAPPAA